MTVQAAGLSRPAAALHEARQHEDGTSCSCGKAWPCPTLAFGDVGLWRTPDHRYFWSEKPGEVVGPLPSITTVMRAVDKSGPLIGWAKRLTAEAAVRNLDVLGRMVAEGGPAAGIDFLKKLADHKRDTAANIGTRVHLLAEAVTRGQQVEPTAEEAPYLDAYHKFLRDWRPAFIAAEYMVCSLKYGYAGTGDSVTEMRGERWRLDTKTTTLDDRGIPKGPYAETALQLAAAHFADFSGRPGDPRKYRVPTATRNGVLHLRPDATYAVVPYEVTEDTFRAFLAAHRLWTWLQGPALTIVGAAA